MRRQMLMGMRSVSGHGPVARPPLAALPLNVASGTRFPSAVGTCQKSHPFAVRSTPVASFIAATAAVDTESNSTLPVLPQNGADPSVRRSPLELLTDNHAPETPTWVCTNWW